MHLQFLALSAVVRHLLLFLLMEDIPQRNNASQNKQCILVNCRKVERITTTLNESAFQ